MARRVLLTGANGFVGSHILDQLLSLGHSVRSIVRSEAKAQQVLADFPNHGSKLDFAIVPDITAPGAFDDVVKSTPPFDTVIHTASPFLYRVISDNREFLDPAIKGTLEVLKSIKANAPSVKRVVITSSCAAVINFAAPVNTTPQKVYTEEDWNPTTWEGALTGTTNNAYQASKKFAELSGTLSKMMERHCAHLQSMGLRQK
jgi:nucleoside-diphosphate-sugar epimerase